MMTAVAFMVRMLVVMIAVAFMVRMLMMTAAALMVRMLMVMTAAAFVMRMLVVMIAATFMVLVMVVMVFLGGDGDFRLCGPGGLQNLRQQSIGVLCGDAQLHGGKGKAGFQNAGDLPDFLFGFCGAMGTVQVFNGVNFLHGSPPKHFYI